MKELSLNILDIAKNSVKAGAANVIIKLEENEDDLKVIIADDGCGMPSEMVARVTDPFCTTRTTRKVGLGIPFYKLAAEQTGGRFEIVSKTKSYEGDTSGTTVTAVFKKKHIDCLPLGDVISTVSTLIQGSPEIDFVFSHEFDGKKVFLSTAEMRELLGDVPLNSPEVLMWIRDYLEEQYN
ncbi:MAG: ATP-binding protein [Clostridia bacterium]|nr:ATP-binding protein [Clostridia bacterium]